MDDFKTEIRDQIALREQVLAAAQRVLDRDGTHTDEDLFDVVSWASVLLRDSLCGCRENLRRVCGVEA